MGFRAPAVLPDYQKLKVLLANSGVQKWNPPTYDILSQLIDAVSQSQDVITATPSVGLSAVSVNGALSGDGSSGSPLAVKVDASTINITGDVLVANIPVVDYHTVAFSITAGQMQTLNSAPVTILTGVANKRIVPIYVATHTQQNVQYTNNVICSLRYSGRIADITTGGTLVIGTTPGTHDWYRGMIPATYSPAGDIVPTGISVVLRGDVDSGIGGGTNQSFITGTFLYALVAE